MNPEIVKILKTSLLKQCDEDAKHSTTFQSEEEKQEYLNQKFNENQKILMQLGIDTWKEFIEITSNK